MIRWTGRRTSIRHWNYLICPFIGWDALTVYCLEKAADWEVLNQYQKLGFILPSHISLFSFSLFLHNSAAQPTQALLLLAKDILFIPFHISTGGGDLWVVVCHCVCSCLHAEPVHWHFPFNFQDKRMKVDMFLMHIPNSIGTTPEVKGHWVNQFRS